MRPVHPVAILAVAALALAACDRPNNTAYNNSGKSAATAPGPIADNTSSPAPTTSTATSDTASPNVAPVAKGEASGPIETVTSTRILAAITADSAMKDADVTVTTADGVVTLGGTAKSKDQVALATGIAQRQDGVARVESQIALQ